MKVNQTHFQRVTFIIHPLNKGAFQCLVLLLKISKKLYKVQRIGIVKGSVLKFQQPCQVLFPVVEHKIIRGIVHVTQQLFAFVNNGFSLTPCQCGGQKPSNFTILL